MDASDPEAPSGTQTCSGVSPVQPRILHPNWTLTYGLEHVCPVLYWNFSAGCEVRHRIWMHPPFKPVHEPRHVLGCHQFSRGFYIRIGLLRMAWNTYVLCCIGISVLDVRSGTEYGCIRPSSPFMNRDMFWGVTSSAADFTSELDSYVWPGTRMSCAVLEFQCWM